MRHVLLTIVALFAPWFVVANHGVASARVADKPRVDVQLSRDRIYKGETVELRVDILDVEPQGLPELVGFDEFEVAVGGDTTLQSSFSVFINGQQMHEEKRGHRYQYFLTPKEAGRLVVPPVIYHHDGKEYRGPQLSLDVIPPQKQDLVHLVTAVERVGKYPMQPITLRLKIFVKKLPSPYDSQDPVQPLAEDPPGLILPWANPPEGMTASEVGDWLAPLRSRGRRGGFTVNNITFPSDDPFAIFNGGPQMTVFDLKGRAASDQDVVGYAPLDGRAAQYFVYEMTREFVPMRPGKFSFGAVGVKGQFVVQARNGAIEKRQSVFDESGALEVEVEEAPIEGQPIGFSGAFGSRFELFADVAPKRARVGDPLTLTLSIRGDGNVATQPAPDLSLDPEFASRFKIERPTSEAKDGARVFTYSLRAVSQEVKEVPAVRFSYFDVAKGQYGTARSGAVPIEIDAVDSLDASKIVSGGARPTADQSLERADGLAGNITDPSRVADERSSPRLVFGVVGGLAVAFVLLSLLANWRERAASDPLRRRRRDARARAGERIEQARAAASAGGDAALSTAQSALFGLVADVAGVPEAGMTGKDAAKILAALGTGESLRTEFSSLVAALDDLRYARGAIDPNLLGRIESVIQALISDFDARGRLR